MDSILREEFYNIKKFGVGRVSAFLSEYITLGGREVEGEEGKKEEDEEEMEEET